MNKEVANQLRALLKQYGTDLCNDPKRCRALLMDLCGDHVKEIRILCMALEINVPQELLSARNMPYEIQRSRGILLSELMLLYRDSLVPR